MRKVFFNKWIILAFYSIFQNFSVQKNAKP